MDGIESLSTISPESSSRAKFICGMGDRINIINAAKLKMLNGDKLFFRFFIFLLSLVAHVFTLLIGLVVNVVAFIVSTNSVK